MHNGFRQFLLRGVKKVRAEWAMICTTHNLLKLFTLAKAASGSYRATNARPPCLSGRAPRLLFALEPSEGAQLVPEDGMGAGRAVLDPTDVQGGGSEVHLLPAEVNQLGHPAAHACRPQGP